jgi:hypothetical protein
MRTHTFRAVTLARQPAARRRTAAAASGRPVALVPGSDRAGRAAALLALQGEAGNRAVAGLVTAELVTAARATPPSTAAGGVSLHGETSGNYDGGSSAVVGSRTRRAATCTDCPPEQGCLRITGTLVITYHVDITISMPGVPGGLTACQERRVRAFLRDVLRPHENDHARRLRTYDGTTRRAFDLTGCGQAAVQEKLQEMHDSEAADRAAKADAKSAEIDPFTREIDLDCE